MLRWAFLLVLLSTAALASRADRLSVSPRLDRRDRLGASVDLGPETVFFALTDPGNECSGDPIPGLTFSRASSQPCADASMTTSMVGPNQPSIEADGLVLGSGTTATVPSPFLVGQVKVISLSFAPGASSIGSFFLAMWGQYTAPNSAALMFVNGRVRYEERDENSVAVTWQSPVLPVGPHSVHMTVPPTGPPTLYVDGQLSTFSRTGGG